MLPSKISALITVALVAGMVAITAEAQSPTPECASKLIPCASYLNSTNPPASCCDPLRDAVTNELQCLCNLYSTPGLLASIGVNVTQALRLPGYCKIPGDLSACKGLAGTPSPSTKASPSPPAAPSGNHSNGVERIISWTGLSSVVLLLASMMLIS